MEVRGIRKCKECGAQWSYYETGSPTCPECGGLYSVGIGERTLHTDRPAELDLEAALAALADGRYREAGDAAEETARQYVHRRGFINAGDLRPLDDPFLAAAEVRHVAQHLRLMTPAGPGAEDIDIDYVRVLFEAADEGTRPSPAAVPKTMASPRGLGVVDAVSEYHDALKRWQDATESDVEIAGRLDRLDSHVRRIRALEGMIDPESAEKLVVAARAIGDYARTGTGKSAIDQALESIE